MTVLDVKQRNARGQYVGELSFEVETEDDWLDLPFTEFSTPVQVSLHYEINEDDSVDVLGKVIYTLKGSCARCLREVEQTFVGEIDAYFVAGESDGEGYGYQKGVIDFKEMVRDCVLFSLPSRLVCDGECELPEYRSN